MSLWKLITAAYNAAGDWARVRIDAATSSLQAILYAHHEIHAGSSFASQAVDLTMSNTDTLVLAWKTPDTTKWGHFTMEFITNGDAHIELLEGPTWNNQSGSLNPIYNRNRNSANSSVFLEDSGQAAFTATDNLILNPTGLAGGTAVDAKYTFGEKEKVQGGGRGRQEWVLKQNTQYAAVVTSDTDNNKCQNILNWYEHTNHN